MTGALLRALVTLALTVLTVTACLSVVPDPGAPDALAPAPITLTLED